MAKEIMGFDSQFLKQIKTLFQETNIEEIEISEGEDMYFRVSRRKTDTVPHSTPAVSAAPLVHSPIVAVQSPSVITPVSESSSPTPTPEASPSTAYDDESKYHKIKSPIVGTFYEKPSPDSPPYVKVGDFVSPDTTVGIVEAMKVMNEIKAEVKGKIVEILKTNGSNIQAGDVLFIVEKM